MKKSSGLSTLVATSLGAAGVTLIALNGWFPALGILGTAFANIVLIAVLLSALCLAIKGRRMVWWWFLLLAALVTLLYFTVLTSARRVVEYKGQAILDYHRSHRSSK